MQKLLNKIPLNSRWRLALKTIPMVVAIVLVKFVVHYSAFEFLTLNSLFTAIISANIFLIGFLISGTLVDYKESEKLPGDLAASLETMADEGSIIFAGKKNEEAKNYLRKLALFNETLIKWFYKKERTDNVMKLLSSFNDNFLVFEGLTQANFIVRLKQEQNMLRKMIIRIHTIRETSFLGTGYAIAEIITAVLVIGLIFIKIRGILSVIQRPCFRVKIENFF
jgi:branched-subunit amino acid transport protein AzlD